MLSVSMRNHVCNFMLALVCAYVCVCVCVCARAYKEMSIGRRKKSRMQLSSSTSDFL